MSQYFMPVNADRKEYFSPPSAMNPVERLTDPIGMAMLGFLMLEGPQDGTRFSSRTDPDDPQLQEAIEEFIEQEKEHEEERFEKYTNNEDSIARRRWARKHDVEPEDEPDYFEQFCRAQASSAYRKNTTNYHWDRQAIATSVAAGLEIAEANEYAGRWAGDDVRLVGDYAESELYDETKDDWVYEYEGEEFVNYATGEAPIVPESIEREDIVHSIEDRDVEPGDLWCIEHPELEEKV